ncbi:hypothetical protein HOE67_02630 [Candidatus Peregrinibacteria bacterium]|jgi:hypothetical protein|nr:hypothetical protein [Candidatus Peregrinibacteria bacterium]MBT4055982.1 hypothetical protein [Candidatus Peregrinibacteria bacterium]
MKCTQCSEQFEQTKKEHEVYEKFGAKLPTTCPDCRHHRHLIFRNERSIFYNKSHVSGKTIVSMIPPTSPFKVIDQDEWWNDKFDASVYGRDYDFNKPFFQQFKELQKDVPRWARLFVNCENSEFTNNSADVKDCYLTFSSYESENLYYCTRVFKSNTCVDCMNVKESEYCSLCMDCQKCYNIHYSQSSEGCHDSYFLYDCRNCKNCIMSAQLRNKEYCILNKQYSEEEYEKHKIQFLKNLADNKQKIEKEFEDLKKTLYHKHLRLINTENSVGDFITGSKNINNGFYIVDCEDCINVRDCSTCRDCYDNLANEKSELCLEADTSYELYNSKFCTHCVTMRDVTYGDQCFKLEDCFGCIGLKQSKNMILNKKYSEKEYKELIPKIKEHMLETGEWGRPFPPHLTPWPYNITVAHEHYPMTKDEAIHEGYMWHEEQKEAQHFSKEYEIPSDIDEVDDSICDKILICEETGKNYKVIPQEYKFYKKFEIPIPRITPYQRYKSLLSLQPPKKLRETNCNLCDAKIQTIYPEKSGYKIVCDKCYLEKVY